MTEPTREGEIDLLEAARQLQAEMNAEGQVIGALIVGHLVARVGALARALRNCSTWDRPSCWCDGDTDTGARRSDHGAWCHEATAALAGIPDPSAALRPGTPE